MHCKGYLITKKIPTEDEVSKILEKYREDDDFSWDWWQIGGRYGGEIKIRFNPDENEDNWYCFQDRNNKYFISQAINEIKEKYNSVYDELDWLKYMGLRENILYVDGGYYNDIINFEIDNCYLVIDAKGNLYIREKWNGENFVEQNDFDKEIKKIDLKDKFITIIDFHY